MEFLRGKSGDFGEKDLIYLDPPYFAKGRMLYYDAYKPDDHAAVAQLLADLEGAEMGGVLRRRGNDT